MSRALNRLSARAVTTVKSVGMHADGAGLYLRVRGETMRSWVFVWHAAGKRREMGLGAPPRVGLARARDRAQAAREIIEDGGDPLAARRAVASTPTFGSLADAFIEDRAHTVRSQKSIDRWRRAIGPGGHAEALRALRVDKVSTEDVLGVLKPLWTTKASTAGLVRGYIEAVLNLAKASGHRRGENPAAWQGHLALILPRRETLSRGHHAAMPFAEVPAFIALLRQRSAVAARALELTILCATRTSETLGARWEEFDLERAIWTIPGNRMKAAKEHRIPLSKQAIQILCDLIPGEGLVFPGFSPEKPLSNMAMEMMMRRMKVDVTVHGFRSSFRDWAGEATEAPRELAEAALAHTIGDTAEQAYRRGDALERRRGLMEAWAVFCSGHAKGDALVI